MTDWQINQGNVALKRVVEAIANGDSHIPFRDSKLTMLLQDSFEDGGSKILMVLCASPDPRDIHKIIGTLEYGAKSKCIVRCSNSPSKEKLNPQDIASTLLGARIAVMDEYILKLQLENQLKDKEKEAAQRELLKKEKEVAKLKAKLEGMQACVQQMKDKYMSPPDEVQNFPLRSVPEGGLDLNGHVEVIPRNEKSLHGLGAVNESNKENLEDSNASYKPRLDSKAGLGEDSSMMDLSDQFNNSFYPVNKDERVLIHQRFPFLRSIATGNCVNDHPYSEVSLNSILLDA